MLHYEDAFWPASPHSLHGFDELHQFAKQGNEFCREIATIFSERADAEKEYSKTLQKIAKKARGISKLCIGSLSKTWQHFVDHLDMLGDAHRNLSTSLVTESHKPMKLFVDGQVKQRKPVEQVVRDSHKMFLDRRNEELRAKKSSHSKSKECHTVWDQLEGTKNGQKALSDKEASKLDGRFRKAEESLLKADREYKELNRKSETARLHWEASMHRCCMVLENLETERLNYIRNSLSKYTELATSTIPVIQTTCDSLMSEAEGITPDDDIRLACETHGTGPNQPEQLLYDCYEQDLSNSMDKERRKTSLSRRIREFTEDIQRQVKAKEGIDNLKRVYDSTPDFCDEKAQDDVNRQLYEADALLNLMKASRYQLMCAHHEMTGQPHPIEAYNEYITINKDKGMNSSVMRIPQELLSSLASCDIDYTDDDLDDQQGRRIHRGSKLSKERPPSISPDNQHYQVPNVPRDYLVPVVSHEYNYIVPQPNDMSPDDGDFSEPEDDHGGSSYVGKCEVLYDYEPQQSDELKIVEGDLINVIDKQEDDWWQGELNGQVGIFPATYVQEIVNGSY